MTEKYIRTQLRELDDRLRRLPRDRIAEALENYRVGFVRKVQVDYPGKFTRLGKQEFTDVREDEFHSTGTCLGEQVGVEVDNAVRTILTEIEEIRTRLINPSKWRRLIDFFENLF